MVEKSGVSLIKPQISIIIPTLNEGTHLPICLDSVRSQNEKDTEILVVDSGSTDGTREAATKFGATIIDYPGRPLGARYEGLKKSRGELILNLDADQVLCPDTLKRALTAIQGLDMLALEEFSYQPKGFLQNSIARQKAALQQSNSPGKLPAHCYPRFFRRAILEEAFLGLPEDDIAGIFLFDDRILFARALKSSKKVGFLSKGVQHIEEDTWLDMMRHAYRTGKSIRGLQPAYIEEASPPEPPLTLLRRAARNRYLAYSLMKEIATRLGMALGR